MTPPVYNCSNGVPNECTGFEPVPCCDLGQKGLSTGAIVGIAIGSVIGGIIIATIVVLIIVGVACVLKKSSKKGKKVLSYVMVSLFSLYYYP